MGEDTAISWCDHTFNLWWGCWKIARECEHCYAEAFARRVGHGTTKEEIWGRTAARRFLSDDYWRQPLKWNAKAEREGKRRNVFCGSMNDWAERHPNPEIARIMDAYRGRMWRLIRDTPWLNWLLLTKRPEDAAELVPWADGSCDPYENVWLGVSCGTRDSIPKIEQLRKIRARVRFVSGEPLLEGLTSADWNRAIGIHPTSIDCPTCHAWKGWACNGSNYGYHAAGYHPARVTAARADQVHLLIIGDESGHHARPADLEWVRVARDAAARHGVLFHFKQWNTDQPKKIHLPILDGKQHTELPT